MNTGIKICLTILLITGCSGKENNDEPLMRIGLVADCQYEDRDNAGTRHYRESPGKLRSACDTFNYYNVGFVQTLGDMINGKWESFDSILPVFGKLNNSIETFHLLGNHEFAIDSLYMPQLLTKLDMPSYYYSHSFNNWRFIVLDATDCMEASLPLHPENRELLEIYRSKAVNANDHQWNGAIGPGQQKWLTRQLDSAVTAGQYAVIFCHMPVRSEKSSSENLLNDYEIDSLIAQYPCVKAFISGHYHGGGYVEKSGIKHVTVRGMVEGSENSFAIMEVYKDHIRIDGFGGQRDIN